MESYSKKHKKDAASVTNVMNVAANTSFYFS